MKHRWSGWPGAWCLDCGIEDPREICLAVSHPLDCEDPKCQETEYLEPGSRRCDPYYQKDRRDI